MFFSCLLRGLFCAFLSRVFTAIDTIEKINKVEDCEKRFAITRKLLDKLPDRVVSIDKVFRLTAKAHR